MKKGLLKFTAIISLAIFYPITTFAAMGGLADAIAKIKDILGTILPVLISFGVVYFVWGIVTYVIADGEEDKKKGKSRMIYGVIGFAVIVGMWGLVNIITTTFGIENTTAPAGININGTVSTACTIGTNFQGLLGYVTCIINKSIIPLIFSIAVVMFIWGAVNFFIINADEEAKRAQGRQFMIWGIIALTVMLSVWGLVGILGNTFDIGTSVLPQVTPPGSNQGGSAFNCGQCTGSASDPIECDACRGD